MKLAHVIGFLIAPLKNQKFCGKINRYQRLVYNMSSKQNDLEYDAMISYNWDYKEIAREVYEELTKAGIKVWMDIKNGIKTGDIYRQGCRVDL